MPMLVEHHSPLTNYNRGRALEYRAMRILRDKNCLVIRSAGSHGPCDLLAADPAGTRYAIQVKSGSAKASRQERIALKFVAARFAATAQVWTFRPREPVQVETL